jgi:porin
MAVLCMSVNNTLTAGFFKLTCYLSFIGLTLSVNLNAQNGSLTGNWGGTRDSLKKSGLSLEPRLTFFQHNFVAGTGNNKSILSGKADVMIKFNGKKLNLSRWTLVTHIEQNFGQTLNQKGGVLIPTNTATTFPGLGGSKAFDFSSLHLVHQFGKANILMVGKINMIDVAGSTRFSGGAGIDAFWNMNFAAPISGILPPYLLGAISIIKTNALKYTFMVYDPRNYANKFPVPLKNISFNAGAEKEWVIAGKKGTHAINMRFSTQDGADLYDLGDLNLPTIEDSLGRKNSRWFVNYVFNQPLFNLDENGKGWGIFGQIGLSDGNPNPIEFGMLMGIGGNSFFKNRSNDRWGLAIYNYSLSGHLEKFSMRLGKELSKETGVELFYQAWLTNWFSAGANVQWINPVIKDNDNAVFLGLRTSIRI